MLDHLLISEMRLSRKPFIHQGKNKDRLHPQTTLDSWGPLQQVLFGGKLPYLTNDGCKSGTFKKSRYFNMTSL